MRSIISTSVIKPKDDNDTKPEAKDAANEKQDEPKDDVQADYGNEAKVDQEEPEDIQQDKQESSDEYQPEPDTTGEVSSKSKRIKKEVKDDYFEDLGRRYPELLKDLKLSRELVKAKYLEHKHAEYKLEKKMKKFLQTTKPQSPLRSDLKSWLDDKQWIKLILARRGLMIYDHEDHSRE